MNWAWTPACSLVLVHLWELAPQVDCWLDRGWGSALGSDWGSGMGTERADAKGVIQQQMKKTGKRQVPLSLPKMRVGQREREATRRETDPTGRE